MTKNSNNGIIGETLLHIKALNKIHIKFKQFRSKFVGVLLCESCVVAWVLRYQLPAVHSCRHYLDVFTNYT